MTITQILETNNLVPPQKAGSRTGATMSVETLTRHQARFLFAKAKLRLMDVNQWSCLCGTTAINFRITDAEGQLLDTANPEIGNLIRISCSVNDDESSHYWVRIEQFEDHKDEFVDEEHAGFRVRSVKSPLDAEEDACFYEEHQTSTFLIIRKGNSVIALERGRNEQMHNEPVSFFAKVRCMLVSLRSMAGFSDPQWKKLMKGIIHGAPVPENRRT